MGIRIRLARRMRITFGDGRAENALVSDYVADDRESERERERERERKRVGGVVSPTCTIPAAPTHAANVSAAATIFIETAVQ